MDMLKNGWGNLNRFFSLLDPEFDEQHFDYESMGSSRQVRACGAGQFSQFNSASWRRRFNRSRSSAAVHQSISNVSQASAASQPQNQPQRQYLCVIDVPKHEASKGEILPPKVFSQVVSYLYTQDLQNCRLVCRLWKNNVGPFFKEKSCIAIDGRHVGSLLSGGCAEKCLKYLKHSVSKFSSWTTLRLRFMKESQIKLLLKSADFQIAAKSIFELELLYCEFSWVSLLKVLKHFINLQCFIDNHSVYKSPEPSSAFERFHGANLFSSSSSSSSSNGNANSNSNNDADRISTNATKSRITIYKEALGLTTNSTSRSSDDSTSNSISTSTHNHGNGHRDRLDTALLQAAVGHEELKCLKILKENCNKNTTDLLKLFTILTMDIEEFYLKVNPQSSSVSIQETYEFERHLSIFLFMNKCSFTHLYFDMMDTSDIGYFNDFLKLFQDWISPPSNPTNSVSPIPIPTNSNLSSKEIEMNKQLNLQSLTLKFKYVWLSKSFEMILIPLIRKCRMLEQLGMGLVAFKPESAYLLNMVQESLPAECEMEFALYLSDHEGTRKTSVDTAAEPQVKPKPEVEEKENKKPKDGKSDSKSTINSQSATSVVKKRKRFFSFQDAKWYRQQKLTDLLIGIFHDKVESVRELLSDEKLEKPEKDKEKNDDKNTRLKQNGPQLSKSFLATKQYNSIIENEENTTNNKFSRNFQHVVDLHIFTNESRRNFKSFDIPFLTELFTNLTKFELVDGPFESYWGKNVQYHNLETTQTIQIAQNNNINKNSKNSTPNSTVKKSKPTYGFKIHSQARITDADLQSIITNLKKLKTLLIFANMETVTNSGLTGLSPQVCQRMIKTKDFNVRSRNEFQGVSLSTLKHLQYLSLRGIGPNLTDVCVHWGFAKMRHLRTLIISRFTWLTADGRQLLDMMYPESKCFLGAL